MGTIRIVMLLSTAFVFAQASRDSKPASSNVLDAQFPQVDSNSRALIRTKAAGCHSCESQFVERRENQYGMRRRPLNMFPLLLRIRHRSCLPDARCFRSWITAHAGIRTPDFRKPYWYLDLS